MNPDYRSSNLQRRSFRGQNLSGTDFSRTDLSGADFTDAILDGADFSHADLRGAVFRRSSLIGANLQFSRSGITSDQNLIFRSVLLILAVLLGLLAGLTCSLIFELLINESRVLDIYHNVKFVIPWQTVAGLIDGQKFLSPDVCMSLKKLLSVNQGLPLDRSVHQAREQLQGLEDRYPCASWLPIVCQNPAENI